MKRKLNGIDYTILALAVAALVFLGFRFLKGGGDSGERIKTGNQKVIVECELRKVSPDLVDALKVGDPLVAQGKLQDGRISEIQVEDEFEIVAKDGKIVKVPNLNYRFLRVKIEANASRFGPYMDVGGQAIQAGNTYYIKTEHFVHLSMISRVTIVEESDERK